MARRVPAKFMTCVGSVSNMANLRCVKQPHGTVQGDLESTCNPPSLNIEIGFLELN